MQRLKKTITQRFALLLCTIILLNTPFVFAESNTENHAQHTKDWSGIYNGFTPCTDCQGIKTTLALNPNNSYILISQYVGKSEREMIEKGKFIWNSEDNSLVLTPRKNLPVRRYLMEQNELIQLDDNGHRILGNHANRYVLHKNQVISESAKPHSGH